MVRMVAKVQRVRVVATVQRVRVVATVQRVRVVAEAQQVGWEQMLQEAQDFEISQAQ
jgi:hypothetical protein